MAVVVNTFTGPRLLADRNDYRLVIQAREQDRWPNISDLVLERRGKDAMGQPVWEKIDSWMLTPQRGDGDEEKRAIIALALLTTEYPPVER